MRSFTLTASLILLMPFTAHALNNETGAAASKRPGTALQFAWDRTKGEQCAKKCNGVMGGCSKNPPATQRCWNRCMGEKICPEN